MRLDTTRWTVCAALVLFVGCSSTTSTTALLRERDANGDRVRRRIELAALVQDGHLAYLRDAAILSAAVYPSATAVNDDDPPLPSTPAWTPVENVPRLPAVRGRLETPDLTYRVWVNTTASPAAAMIVFRGTYLPLDWYSNLRWVTAAIPRVEDHYDQTIKIMPDVVRHIRSTYGPETVIFAAGHSLGGGLAQTAAYTTCGDITTVFAFDSSPVTKHRARNRCASGKSAETFYRVFERSEVLSYARFWIRLALGLRQENPHFTEIKVSLLNAFGIRAHSMRRLAVELDRGITQSAGAGDVAIQTGGL